MLDLLDEAVRHLRTGGVVRRVEARLEEPDEQPYDAHVRAERLLDVVLAERETGLAQILGVGAQHDRLPPPEPCAQHECVQPVALGATGPDGRKGVLEKIIE